MTFIPIEMNAERVCDAIARIGYLPASAIMDIIDNGVAANARRIVVDIALKSGTTFSENNNIEHYHIFDDGDGMNDRQITHALQLGSSRNYPSGSLSKYGMGLKSAGFSLGTRIEVLSKQAGTISQLHYLDRDVIAKKKKYGVCRQAPSKLALKHFTSMLSKAKSGTMVTLSGCDRPNHDSARKTIDRLQERLGVTYYTFLTRDTDPLKIIIRCAGKPDVNVEPFDILFLEDARPEFDPDNYDCIHPCKVLNNDLQVGHPGTPPIRIEAVIFPKHSMSTHATLTDEQREQIKRYRVTRKNMGFFVYRNGRLIRWGDTLDGTVGKDDLGFRARINLTTDHDDFLHVDVSKQQLAIPEDILGRLDILVRNPLKYAKEAFDLCQMRFGEDEGDAFNQRNQDLDAEDLDAPETSKEREQQKQRKKELADKTKQELAKAGEELDNSTTGAVTQLPPFERVRYSERIAGSVAWESGLHPTDGTFVRINKNHPFYGSVISRLTEDESARQAIEAVLYSCAAAENSTMSNLTDLDEEVIIKVLTRFKRVFASTLDNWVGMNQDLFTDD